MIVLSAMLLAVLGWSVTALACIGWGAAFLKLMRMEYRENISIFAYFWAGFGVLICLLQLYHFVLPIDWRASTFILGIGAAIALTDSGVRQHWGGMGDRNFILTAILLALWIANRGLDFARNYDSGLYHFSTIRWENEHSIVPGLANLNVSFGFNQSFFLFVALLNVYPFFNQGYHVASSLLIFVLTIQALKGTFSLLRKSSPSWADSVHCLLLPVCIAQALGGNISSPSPDIAVFACGIATFTMLIRWLERSRDSGSSDNHLAPILILLCVVGTTIKLSFAVFAIATIGVIWRFEEKAGTVARRKRLLRILLIGIFVGGAYAIRGIILSGYPAFPLAIGSCPVDWRVPLSETQDAANWIYSWARSPGVNWREVLGSWEWIGPWWVRTLAQPEFRLSLEIGSIALLALLVSVAIPPRKPRPVWPLLPPFLPLVVGIAAWFFTAPDPRFGNWLFWLFAVWASSCVLWITRGVTRINLRRTVGAAMLISAGLIVISQPSLWLGRGGHGFAWLPRPATKIFVTSSGLKVLLPENPNDVRLWDSALPTAVQAKADLQARGPTLREGFRQRLSANMQPAK